jgi:serine/threonine-protein kinase
MVKVLDFGLAKWTRPDQVDVSAETGSYQHSITSYGSILGTVSYMSPEQAQGKPLDERSDLYSLGVILYQMVTGRPPFTDEDAIVVMARHIKTVPKRPSEVCPEAGCPPELERIIMGALAKEPRDRPANADAFMQELHRVVDSVSAITSGVRSSVGAQRTSWAGQTPVPSLPGQRRSAGSIVALLAGLAVGVGTVVFLAVHLGVGPSRTPFGDLASPRPPPPRPATVVTAPPRTLEPARFVESDVPTIAAENLPKASASASVPIRSPESRPPRAGAPAGSARPPRPQPSASGGYGIFD